MVGQFAHPFRSALFDLMAGRHWLIIGVLGVWNTVHGVEPAPFADPLENAHLTNQLTLPASVEKERSDLAVRHGSLADPLPLEPTADPPLKAASTATTPSRVPPNELLPEKAGVISSNLMDLVNNSAGSDEARREYEIQLVLARRQRLEKSTAQASKTLISILESPAGEQIKKAALLELAQVARDDNQLVRAQQIYAQYRHRYPDDPSLPSVLLQQGILYRDMGSTTMALAKFYEVMTCSLHLKTDRFKEYQNLVLHAQMEIAETYYLQCKYVEAAQFYQRLLNTEASAVSKKHCQFKLIRSLSYLQRAAEAATQAQDFLTRYANQPEEPEVRFLLASALKQQGRNRDSLQQVLLLLETQSRVSQSQPAQWIYWQQRTGNEIANQLYKEGDYLNALEIYLHLAKLDRSAQWQLPVWYQAGLTCERLGQPQKATEYYDQILSREKETSAQSPPGLRTVLDMAKWRKDFLMWTFKADQASAEFKLTAPAVASEPSVP